MDMDDVRGPVQFLYGFHYAFCKEDRPFIIIGKGIPILIRKSSLPFKILIIIDKIYLNALSWYGSNFYDQGHVHIIDHQIHPRQSDHFVQLMSSFIDIPEPGHKNPDLAAIAIDHSWGFVGH